MLNLLLLIICSYDVFGAMKFIFRESTSLLVSLRCETKAAAAKSHRGCDMLTRETGPFGAHNKDSAAGAEKVIISGKVILCRPCIILMYDITRTRFKDKSRPSSPGIRASFVTPLSV